MKQPEGIVQKLVTVGLTPQEAGIYLALLKNQKLRVRDVARELGIMVPSVHRSLASLKRKGFVTTFGKRPLKLMAVEPKLALGKLVGDRYQNELAVERQIEEALKRQTSPEAELGVEFLESKQATYEYTLPLINKLQKEMLILSVGEPIPEEIFLALFRAIKRGVVVKMLAETYNETNRELLKNWKKNGWQVRYMPKPTLDFTLTILDGTVAVVQIRREKEKDQRVGIVIHNPAYAAAQREYFTALWQKAKET
ncbi:MAG: helix-turn-helix domain-containing protein [Candidatus Gottesmanbacteria bacterium]|nr:helix-turn-helix domain-containing protein [Candidatus Gottesmanbacteria bacterium]